jgi:imidazolonepropionase-like amidohydrolase
MRKVHFLVLLLTGFVMLQSSRCQDNYELLIKNVNVIDVKEGKTIIDQNVYIKADRIVAIVSSKDPAFNVKNTIDGTDAMNPYCWPGYSLHRELVLLKECGIPDADILKMATVNPAEFFSLKDYGQVKTGFIASLVLLDANPLLNINNTSKINSLILKGSLIDKASLKNLEDQPRKNGL